MIREAFGEAKDIEEAVRLAKQNLNAPADADVSVEVVSAYQKKVLGLFGGSLAKVRVFYDDGKKEAVVKEQPKREEKAPAQKPQKQQSAKKPQNEQKQKAAPAEKAAKPAPAQKSAPKQESNWQPLDDATVGKAIEYLQSILKGLAVDDAVITKEQKDGTLSINIECADYGIIIGRRGETLDSIQYLVSLVANKGIGEYTRVVINIGNYREKRAETLKALAKKNVSYVLRTGRRTTLEPMNPYERRIIHTTVQGIDGVTSRSIGSNNERRVVIEAEGGERRFESRDRRDSRPRQQSRPSGNSSAQEKKAPPKFGKIE